MKVTTEQRTCYKVTSDRGDWAEITTGSIPTENGFSLTIRSAFGNWGYSWGAPGNEGPIMFLDTADDQYLMNKFSRCNYLYKEETIDSLKQLIITGRREGWMEADHAREIWDEIPEAFEYAGEQAIFDRLPYLWEYELFNTIVRGPDPQIVGFFKYIFRPWIEYMKSNQEES